MEGWMILGGMLVLEGMLMMVGMMTTLMMIEEMMEVLMATSMMGQRRWVGCYCRCLEARQTPAQLDLLMQTQCDSLNWSLRTGSWMDSQSLSPALVIATMRQCDQPST